MNNLSDLRIVLVMFLFFPATALLGQCPQLNDGTGTASLNPYWIAPCNGLDYNLFVQSPDNIGTWTINWGGGSPIDSGTDLIPPAFISHTYTATVDTFIVDFKVTSSGCTVQGVVVMERPVTAEPGIPGGVSTQICEPYDIIFVNNTSQADGLTAYDHTSSSTVFYNRRLIVSIVDGCTDTACHSTEVYPEVAVAFFAPDTAGCHPLSINFVEQAFGAQLFDWDFGDVSGSTSNALNHTFQNTGTSDLYYAVQLIGISTFGCSDTTLGNVTVHPKPVAGFNYSPFVGCHPLTVDFFNTSMIATIFDWNLGDGGTSTDEFSEHYYTTAEDVYVWKSSGKYVNGNEFNEIGDLTLIR